MGVRLSLILGTASVLAVGISHLALTDIAHGTGGAAEWRALQTSFVLIITFHVVALATLWRMRIREHQRS